MSNTNPRTCIVTRKQGQKEDMIRVALLKDGTVKITDEKIGKGAYISKSEDVLKKLDKNKSLHKVFRTNVDNSIYESIEKIIRGG